MMKHSPSPARALCRLLPAVLMLEGACHGATAGWSRADFEREVLVIRQRAGEYGPGGIGQLERQSERKLNADEKRVFGRRDDGAWKVFEDEFVRFEVPDDPLLKIEPLQPQARKRIQIVGDAASSADNRYARAYRMTVNGLPYGVVLLSEADWFDEGLCLCGPIVMKRLVLKEGTLLEFSLLPEGRVKKVQALGAKHRAVLFEWTHSAITPEAYARIGASIRLVKGSEKTRGEWIELTRKKRPENPAALIGWLQPGAAESEVTALLGEANRREGNRLVYEEERWGDDGSGQRRTISIPLKKGKLSILPENYLSYENLQPRQGSLEWAKRVIQPEQYGDKVSKIDRATAQMIFAQFKQQAPTTTNRSHWNAWCQVLHDLAKMGHRDETVAPVVRERFLSTDLEQHYAGWVLKDYRNAETEELYRKRLQIVLKDCTGPKAGMKTDPGESWNLLKFMEMKEAASLDLLRETLKHPNDTVRADGYGSGTDLPPAEARQAARHAIETEEKEHNLIMATYLIRDTGTAGDADWLSAAKGRYTTPELQKRWQEAMEEIQKRPAAKE
ncbi:hypothetical protein [Prosthecobacter sp.]|uniref:hypothetical protein n=1 Tax=Prosthecobacter sp. TaxID=1965333 RepID=UPI0037833994